MLGEFWVHQVSLARYVGPSSTGDVFTDPVQLMGLVVPGERIYRTADGREKVASGTVFLPVDVDPPGLMSEVTCAHPGMHGRVAQVNVWDSGALGLPECIELVVD